MSGLENDTRELILSAEAVAKADSDIETIGALDTYAREMGIIFLVPGGYATEAHCGGRITRPHGDIDGQFIIADANQTERIFAAISTILQKEKTRWILRNKTAERFEYWEDDPTKTFDEKRRLEIKINTKDRYRPSWETKQLVNSRGEATSLNVVNLIDLVAGKIHKLYLVKDGITISKDRHTSVTDYFDLKRLLALRKLDKESLITALGEFAGTADAISARQSALREYEFSVSLLAKH